MPSFGKRSTENLLECDERLQKILREAIKHVDFAIIEGHRGRDLQNHYFAIGTSKIKWPNGKHNKKPSLAADIIPWPSAWKDEGRLVELGRFVQGIGAGMGHPIRWGGDWDGDFDRSDQSFHDLAHLELL